MNRRHFLHLAAGAAATAPAVTAPPAVAAPTPARPRIGFLGVAYSHAAEKIRILRNSADFAFAGIWAENDTLARRYAAQGVPLLSQDELLRSCEVIVVESDVPTHALHARLALEAGCHVHLEKPPALSLAEFDPLIRLAREKRRHLQIGYMWRYHPGLRTVFEAIRNGWLGEVFLVRGMLNNTLATDRRAAWAGFPGGVLFELGSHLIDAIVRLLGRPDRVTPFLKTHGGSDSLADNNVVVFEYPRATALLTSATLQPNAGAHRAFEVLGTRGSAVVRPLEPPSVHLDLADAAGPYRRGPQEVPQPAYRRYVEEFIDLARVLRDGGPLPVSLDQERTIQETLLRACGAA